MTRDEALAGAAAVLAQARLRRDAQTPREAAKAAWYPGYPISLAQLEALIIRQREEATAALAAGHRTAA
ncbi:hypothetical protein [Streptacidiphilus sp. PAMC 29251]